ncbi:uncharacterized protein LOC100908555 [Galendromus occidentalis]|uniref:Uncharacterized protein LOC100908555 n=1 Tax=Galendromus occidentalis TaxID=34638 RepID=A0AAJ6QQV7_9ACAR|nr:uncharacterized protein LOC100908555 [Galendromus occidentalis]
MMCMFDLFKNCLILRHRRSHDITVVPTTKGSFGLTRSSSTTSIISCTKKQDDLPPLGTLPRNTSNGNSSRPISLISTPIPEPPNLPARPNSILGLPSIPEISNAKISPEAIKRITIIPDDSGSFDAFPIEPEYSEPLGSIDSALPPEKIYPDGDDYPYHDIYEEIRHRDHIREDDLPDVVTSAYASGDQVYQELLDLVKEEEIKEEKRRSQLFSAETKGNSVNSLDSSDGSYSPAESNPTDDRDNLRDLYAVPKRTRTEGPRLPPRRVKSNHKGDPNWAPKVPEKSSLLRRSLSDTGGANDDNNNNKRNNESDRQMKGTHQQRGDTEANENGSETRHYEVTLVDNRKQSSREDNVSVVSEDAVNVATTTIVIGDVTVAKSMAKLNEIALYEESHVRNDRLI